MSIVRQASPFVEAAAPPDGPFPFAFVMGPNTAGAVPDDSLINLAAVGAYPTSYSNASGSLNAGWVGSLPNNESSRAESNILRFQGMVFRGANDPSFRIQTGPGNFSLWGAIIRGHSGPNYPFGCDITRDGGTPVFSWAKEELDNGINGYIITGRWSISNVWYTNANASQWEADGLVSGNRVQVPNVVDTIEIDMGSSGGSYTTWPSIIVYKEP